MFKRLVGFFFLLLFALIIVGLTITWTQRSWIVAHYLTAAYGAPVQIERIDVGWGQVILKGVEIQNVEGSALPNAFSAQQVHLHVAPWALLAQEVAIPLIEIEGALLGIELYNLKGSDTNWSRLLERMESRRRPSKRFTVEKVIFHGLAIQAYSYKLKRPLKVQPLDRLVLEEVDPDKPLSAGPISAQVYRALLGEVVKIHVHLKALLSN